MGRLTYREPQTGKIYFYTSDAEVLEKLARYEDLEEQGLLLGLPCRVGDTFWEINQTWLNPFIYPRTAHSLQHVVYCMERLGKTTFLTKEEAKEALAKMKGGVE